MALDARYRILKRQLFFLKDQLHIHQYSLHTYIYIYRYPHSQVFIIHIRMNVHVRRAILRSKHGFACQVKTFSRVSVSVSVSMSMSAFFHKNRRVLRQTLVKILVVYCTHIYIYVQV